MPLEVLLVPVVTPVEPISDGSSAMVLKTFGSALLARSAAPSIWVGVGALKPLEVMRDPVTVTSCTAVGAAWAVEAVI